ncbi:MAG: hypothetical protein HZB19_03625 [Chloroflexi bacterium]|nr:hypothetical protein [Chloroflexota bacterium]
MRKWLLIIAVGIFFAFPSVSAAQAGTKLSTLNVQLWPEYDQPSMLVIYDFTIEPDTQLPVQVTFRIPLDANLIAAASLQDGGLVNIPIDGPANSGEWQSFTITVDVMTTYHFEYYQPLTFNGNARSFNYLWDGSYAVNAFTASVLEPLDTVSFIVDPPLEPTAGNDGNTYYGGAPFALADGEQFVLNLQYEKTTDTLILPQQGLQPADPVDDNTLGRISLANYLPYILGGLGVAFIMGGIIYYWQSGRRPGIKPRRRNHAQAEEELSEVYCHQCGTRAKSSDRFCRVCGSRLRQES